MLTFLAIASFSALMAAEIKIDWSKAKINDETFPGWLMDKYGKPEDLGSGKIIAGSKEGTFAYELTGNVSNTAYYRAKNVKVKVGDIVKISAKLKGNGKLAVGYYCYDYSFVGKVVNNVHEFVATPDFQDVSVELEIKQPLEANRTVTSIRPMIAIRPKSNAVVEDLKIEIIKKEEK